VEREEWHQKEGTGKAYREKATQERANKIQSVGSRWPDGNKRLKTANLIALEES